MAQLNKLPVPLEAAEQAAFVQYLTMKGYKFTMIPNDTYTKSFKQKMRNKRLGLRSGLPDLLVIVQNKLVFIEMKRQKGSTTSQAQKEWVEALSSCQGVSAYIAKGCDAAIEIIENIALENHVTYP